MSAIGVCDWSRKIRYPPTPVPESVDAFHVSEMEVEVIVVVRRFVGVDGGVVSGTLVTSVRTDNVAAAETFAGCARS